MPSADQQSLRRSYGNYRLDRGWAYCRMARRSTDEGWRLWNGRRHHSGYPGRPCGRLGVRTAGYFSWWINDRFHHRGVYRSGTLDWRHSRVEEGVEASRPAFCSAVVRVTIRHLRRSLTLRNHEGWATTVV